MTKDEALKLALDFIENSEGGTADLEAHIKEALAQTEQKPVAWMYVGTHVTKPIHTDDVDYGQIANDDEWFPVYLQPQRTWVWLTDEELLQAYGWRLALGDVPNYLLEEAKQELLGALRKVEAKLKEKNT